MGYLFGSGNTNVIATGTGITGGSTFSLFVRLAPTAFNSNLRLLVRVGDDPSNVAAQIYLAGSNNVNCNFAGAVTAAIWAGALGAGVVVTLVYTFDGSTHRLYANTDATPKATGTSETAVPPTPAHLYIGNAEPANTFSADATIYEAGWWPGTVLSGGEAAGMGAGTPPGTLPTDYWPLIADPLALYGGHNGTVTGASVVAHSGVNLYGAIATPSIRTINYHGA